MIFLIAINTLLFLLIAAIHIYWAFGGKWGINAVLPTKSDGNLILQPSPIGTLCVAAGLLILAIITICNADGCSFFFRKQYIEYGNYAITALFFLRAIGDFMYIGFTKRIKNTLFATNDTKFYSPLCLFISAVSLGIVILTT
jgi:Protein of unknown function (DUF3995)